MCHLSWLELVEGFQTFITDPLEQEAYELFDD